MNVLERRASTTWGSRVRDAVESVGDRFDKHAERLNSWAAGNAVGVGPGEMGPEARRGGRGAGWRGGGATAQRPSAAGGRRHERCRAQGVCRLGRTN